MWEWSTPNVEPVAYREEQGGNAVSELACFVDLHLQLKGRIQQCLSDSHWGTATERKGQEQPAGAMALSWQHLACWMCSCTSELQMLRGSKKRKLFFSSMQSGYYGIVQGNLKTKQIIFISSSVYTWRKASQLPKALGLFPCIQCYIPRSLESLCLHSLAIKAFLARASWEEEEQMCGSI